MVNIEAGRQHTPLHVLWQIAELLETKFTSLIPSPEELLRSTETRPCWIKK